MPAAVDTPVTVAGDVDDSKANSEHVGDNLLGRFRNFDGVVQTLPATAQQEVRFATSPREQLAVMRAANKGNGLAPSNGPYRHRVPAESEVAVIVGNAAERCEIPTSRSVQLVCIRHFGRNTQHISVRGLL